MTARGLFITFEGGEGSGKSTQSERLAEQLRMQGRQVVQVREPGGTRFGEELRNILLSSSKISSRTELLLFLAARSELVEQVIRPALDRGIDVVCDRFTDSTVAYQGYGRGLDIEWIKALNDRVTEGCRPDVTVLLDLDPDQGLARASEGSAGDSIEGHWQAGLTLNESAAPSGRRVGGRDRAFHRRVRRGYLALAKQEPARWLVLDATQPVDELSQAISERVEAILRIL